MLQVHFKLRGTQDMMIFLFVAPFLPDLLSYLIRLVLEGGPKFTKYILAMAVKFEGSA